MSQIEFGILIGFVLGWLLTMAVGFLKATDGPAMDRACLGEEEE